MSTNLPLTQVVALELVNATTGFAVTSGSRAAIWETVDGGAPWHWVAR